MQAEPSEAIASRRLTTTSWPSLFFSRSMKCFSRVSWYRLAIWSYIQSSGFSSHLSEPAARYIAFVGRSGLLESWMVAAPFGQSRPRVCGVSGWPSMSMILSPFEYTSWMHPTAQYGQTPGCTFASLIFSPVAAAWTGVRSRVAAPTATPAPVDPAYLRKSRRDRLMATPRCVSLMVRQLHRAPGRARVESGSGFRYVGPQLRADSRYWSDHQSRESLPGPGACVSR